MKAKPRRNGNGQPANQRPMSAAQELDGLVELGMKSKALGEARRILQGKPITAESFKAAVDAILTLGDRLKSWASVIESAYARLQRPDQLAVWPSMLSF